MDISSIPEASEHWYPFPAVNEPIPLYHGPLDVKLGSVTSVVDGSVRTEFLPTPRLMARASSNSSQIANMILARWVKGRVQSPLALSLSELPPAPPSLSPVPADAAWRTDDRLHQVDIMVGKATGDVITALKFFVVNMYENVGDPIRAGMHCWLGRASLSHGDWLVKLDSRQDLSDVEKQLKARGGYAVTHVGELRRNDSKGFSATDAESTLVALRYALSLAAGRWVAILLPVGFGSDETPVCADWRVQHVHPFHRGHFAVADRITSSHLPELFKAVMNRWSDPFDREVMQRSINYYMEANDPDPVEMAIAAAQSGLELLAWTELVEDRKALTKTKYKNKFAHEVMADLMSIHSVPTTLPSNLAALSLAAKNQACQNGPEIVARVRNGITHPSRTKAKFSIDELVEAWRLSMHYLQLAILGYAKYIGSHRDPLSDNKNVGATQQVPWAP